MRKTIFIPILLLLFCTATKAQDDKYVYSDSSESENVIEIDTTVYFSQLTVSSDTVEAWKNLKSFAYTKYLDSLLKAKKEEENKQKKNYKEPVGDSWLDRLLSSRGLEYFLWGLAIFFVLFILYKLFLTEGAFTKRTASATATPEVTEENISSESDFTGLIRDAVKNGNYRLAVRYQYLQTLHKLANKNFVELATDKTNYQYVREIANQQYQNDFAALTLNYEYVWYGEFNIDENIYRKMEPGFVTFNNKL
jgi:hypothetical protein